MDIKDFFVAMLVLGTCIYLYGLGHPRQPSPRATLAEVTMSLLRSKIQPAAVYVVYITIANSSRGTRELG